VFVQKISNLLSFADTCMSMQVYQYLAVLAFASSLIAAIFSVSFKVILPLWAEQVCMNAVNLS
jgi:hypothetical protein